MFKINKTLFGFLLLGPFFFPIYYARQRARGAKT